MLSNKDVIISQLSFPSGKEYLSHAVKITYNQIIDTSLPIVLSNDELRLVIDESISNAMEHGNSWDSGRRVVVNIERCYKGIRLAVRDEGEGFDVTQMSISRKNLSNRGRGIRILKHYCECSWNPEGNIFSAILPISEVFDQIVDPLLINSIKDKLKKV